MRGWGELLEISTMLCLVRKKVGEKYDDINLDVLLKKPSKSIFYISYNYNLYILLEQKQFLEKAYIEVQNKIDNLEPDVVAKFLSYPIPKAIVEEWEKVK